MNEFEDTILSSIKSGHGLLIKYRKTAEEEEQPRRIIPYSLEDGLLFCFDLDKKQERKFKLAKIGAVQKIPNAFVNSKKVW